MAQRAEPAAPHLTEIPAQTKSQVHFGNAPLKYTWAAAYRLGSVFQMPSQLASDIRCEDSGTAESRRWVDTYNCTDQMYDCY